MSDTRVKFYKGTHGMGIVISVTYENDRIIFDFGAPFEPENEIYDGYVLKREENRVKDALLLGKIPMVPGVFKKKDLKDIELVSSEESDINTAVFINHLHLDHCSEMDKVDPQIPVYIHSDGIKLQKCLEAIGEETHRREYQPYLYHDIIHVGQISVQPFFSDHPCPGASGFLITTPDSTIYYSGDIRFHGMNSQKAFEDLYKVAENNIDLLIVDSTTTSASEFNLNVTDTAENSSNDQTQSYVTEEMIYNSIYAKHKKDDRLIVVNEYNRDVDMMLHIYQLAQYLSRKAVFEASYAYILYQLKGVKVCILNDGKTAENSYLRECAAEFEFVDTEEIRKHPENYILQNSYENILNLIDLDSVRASYYHLFGEPLVPQDKHYKIMRNMVEKLGWEFVTYSNLYSFSHAYPNHLSYMVERIQAKSVVAVHSKHPENLVVRNSHHILPTDGDEYLLKNGELIRMD